MVGVGIIEREESYVGVGGGGKVVREESCFSNQKLEAVEVKKFAKWLRDGRRKGGVLANSDGVNPTECRGERTAASDGVEVGVGVSEILEELDELLVRERVIV